MEFWDVVARIGTAIATGGASEIARAVGEENDKQRKKMKDETEFEEKSIRAEIAKLEARLQELRKLLGDGGRDRPDRMVPPPPAIAGVAEGCCARYQMDDSFMLEVQTGRVWRYDEQTKRLEIVERAATPIERSWEALLTAKLASDLDAAVADATRSSSFNEYKRLGGLLEAHLKAVDAHVQALAAKR